EDVIHNGFQFSCGDKLHHGVQFGLCAHVRTEERKLTAEEKTQVHFGVIAGRGAASDKPTAGRKTSEAVVPSGRADVFEDHIDAALVGDASDFIANFLRLVVDEVVGADIFGLGELFIGTGSGDDTRAKKLGDLNGGAAYAAASAEDENIFGRL